MDNGLSVWEWMLSYVFIGNSSLIRPLIPQHYYKIFFLST